jgi:hypothetical protein
MQTNVIDLTASTTSLPAHGLNEEQLAKLQPVIDLVETQLLHCVDDIRQARWKTDSRLKTRAELNLRQLVVRPQISHFQDILNKIELSSSAWVHC